jgi:two-component system, sensor histidine kinase and response regulator
MSEKKVRLLIIDDENIVHKSCNRILRGTRFEITNAYSGEEGLEFVEKNSYDLVLTDLMMPGISGMEVLNTLIKERPEIIVIVFTGFATVDSAREALKKGAFDYIPKPFTPKELNDVLDNAVNERAERSGQNTLDLMAVVSHDLQSPIAVVHSSAETLHKGYFGHLEPKQQKALEAILRNCEYLEDIIRSHIEFSKMDLENMASYKEKVNLVEEVLNPVLENPEYTHNLKKILIETEYSGEPVVHADPNLLKIVVLNLLTNALKYGRENSKLEIRLEEKEKEVLISFRNEGVGMTQEQIEEKLFKKHSRLKQKGTEGVKGNGLGLFICKNIIEKHQGKLWAESEVGQWAKFSFTLPKR